MFKMIKRYLLIVVKHIILSLAILYIADIFGLFKHCLELDFNMFHYPLHENALENAHKARFNRQLDMHPVNTNNNTFIYNPVQKCYEEGVPSAKLIILVKSAINHFERRSAIRRTWGSELRYPGIIQTVFLLGSSNNEDNERLVQHESEQFNDIVKTNFFDSYYNNTIKTLMGLQWAFQNCDRSSFFMFVDDDYFVSVKNVLTYLSNFSQSFQTSGKLTLNNTTRSNFLNNGGNARSMLSTDADTKKSSEPHLIQMNSEPFYASNVNSRNCLKLFAGFVIKSSPLRHKFSKWYIDLSEYPFDMWPPYVTAGAYVLSRESLTELFFMSMFTKIFKYDDIYLGILALRANLTVTHSSKFYFEKARYSEPKDYRDVIASHGYGNPEELIKTWSECQSAGYT